MSNLKNFLFTSESVSEGHPDKVSDRISDMVVDSYITADPYSRVACETLTTTNNLFKKSEIVLKILGMTKKGLLGKKPLKLKVIFIHNHQILQWVLILKIIKMKVLVTKV